MIIEDPDAFKTWLTAVLKPICEADPSALAKYVIALVKKDKSPEVLRQSMVNQLEVFLQKETEPFVTQLFKTLETQDYINSVIPNANPPNPNLSVKLSEAVTTVTPPAKVLVTQKPLPIIPVSEIAANLTETLNGKGIIKDAKEFEKKDSKKEEEKPLRRRSRHRSLSRNRSRSRSWDRTRRSRSRDKSRERDRLDRDKRERVRSWRNKSPPRRYDRRRSVSPGGRPRSRSRSPRHNYSALPHRGRYRNRSPPLRSTSRSRSRSLDRRDRKDMKDREAVQSGAGTPTQDSNHAVDMDLRLTQSVQSAVVQPPPSNRPPGVPPPPDGNRRCRDYDEKGFCMRGEMCPYDHGVDPVVLEDSTLSRVLYAPNGTGDNMLVPPPSIVIPGPNPIMHMRPNLPAEYNPQAPQMWHHRPPNFRGGHRGGMNSGPPRVPPMGFNPQSGPPLPNIQQRELISVPVLDSGNQQDSYGGGSYQQQQNNGPQSQNNNYNNNQEQQNQQQPGGFKKKPFDYNRLGPRQKNPTNCSLELKKVPTGLNNITHLNNHFHRFGKIVNIQVNYDGDPEAAIVTFSSHAEANVAYRSTEAVLNNRFIKVFWHTGNADSSRQENVPPRTIKERLGGQSGLGGNMHHHSNVAPNANKVLNLVQPKANQDLKPGDAVEEDPEKIKEFEAKREEMRAMATLAIKRGQELLAAKEKYKKNHEQQRVEAFKLKSNLRRRKAELLEKQLAQQKLLIEKLEKCTTGPQKDLLMQTIKKSQESIEAIRKDIANCMKVAAGASSSSSVAAVALLRKTKEEVQKEVLDAELDLISKQAEGMDVTELQKKIFDMKAKIPTLSSSTAAPAMRSNWSRGRARFNPIGRHLLSKNNLLKDHRMKVKSSPGQLTSQQTHAVDHRPTRILVSGYESDEQESVLTHFGQFGEIVEYVSDASTPSVVLNYKTRKEAEFAVVKGKHFQDRTLSVTWCNNAQLNTLTRSSSRTVLINESEEHLIDSALLDGDEEVGTVLPEEVLLQDDEEEEEENEDRSWRR